MYWDRWPSRSAFCRVTSPTALRSACFCCRSCWSRSSFCCARCAGGRFEMTGLMRRLAREGSFYAAVVTLVTFAAFPFYWMLITTFKTDGDLYNLQSNPYWFNTAPTLEHLKYLFEDTLFLQWLWNTALIGVCVVAITILVAVPAGYSLARTPGRTAENLGIGIFLTYLGPPTLLFRPLSRLFSDL